ncbi:MAG: hypothetical protein ACXWHG_12775 [Thermoanaerobaculia bacterium]
MYDASPTGVDRGEHALNKVTVRKELIMRRFSLAFLLIVSIASAYDAHALRLGAEKVIIPIIGRFPGAGGTQWHTDLFLANPYSPTVTVTLRFYPAGAPMQQRTFALPPYSNLTLPDVVLNTFGMVNAGGPLEVSASEDNTTEARARIYNTGNPAGQFGQGVPGIGFSYLNRQAYLFGLNAADGTRLNVGVTNPNDVEATISINVYRDKSSLTLHSRSVTLPPHGNVQYNDIAIAFGFAPQDGIQIEMISSQYIYGYASEVRNDTGDAVFTFGLSPNF